MKLVHLFSRAKLMERRALTFAILLACFLLAVSDGTAASGLKRPGSGNSDVGRDSRADRKALRASKLLHKLIGNSEDKSDCSTRIQYVLELFGLDRRSANSELLLQKPKVSRCFFYRFVQVLGSLGAYYVMNAVFSTHCVFRA